MNQLAASDGVLHCANCGTPMQGHYCHQCGQSVHSVLKPMHGMLEDGMDMFLHVDSRILRTLPALFLKPGLLTLEYFAGRRVRYIAPFRLMFVLCLLAVFAMHLAVGALTTRWQDAPAELAAAGSQRLVQADDAQEVDALLRQQLAALQAARQLSAPSAGAAFDQAERRLREQAAARRRELGLPAAAPAPASSAGEPLAADEDLPHARLKMSHWQVSWLPRLANQRLQRMGEHLAANVNALRQGDDVARREAIERISTGFFGVLPQTMIVMIPLFALLLKLAYLLRRRLYMEHLIVALHSHAFLFLSLLLLVLLGSAELWLQPHTSWLGGVFRLARNLLLLWIPVYLFLAQKRIYRQGWLMHSVSYWLIGWCYLWLLGAALTLAVVLGIAQ